MFNLKRILLPFLCLVNFSAYSLDKGEQDIVGGQRGTYDYLVYAVTWQPTFCTLNAKQAVCKDYRSDFYTHGIWPYFKSSPQTSNRHPSDCIASPGCTKNGACELSKKTLTSMLNDSEYRKIVTSEPTRLMQHEWKKHGTCYGRGQSEYFNEYLKLRKVVTYDSAFKMNIGKSLSMSEIKSWFPFNTSFRCVTVNGKQYLFEVFYLVKKDGTPFSDRGLQIGERCSTGWVTVPDARQ